MNPDRRCAAQLSFWLPGLGQLYLRRWRRGAALLALSWVSGDLAWRQCSTGWTVAMLAVWMASIGDAWQAPRRQCARLPNATDGRPERADPCS